MYTEIESECTINDALHVLDKQVTVPNRPVPIKFYDKTDARINLDSYNSYVLWSADIVLDVVIGYGVFRVENNVKAVLLVRDDHVFWAGVVCNSAKAMTHLITMTSDGKMKLYNINSLNEPVEEVSLKNASDTSTDFEVDTDIFIRSAVERFEQLDLSITTIDSSGNVSSSSSTFSNCVVIIGKNKKDYIYYRIECTYVGSTVKIKPPTIFSIDSDYGIVLSVVHTIGFWTTNGDFFSGNKVTNTIARKVNASVYDFSDLLKQFPDQDNRPIFVTMSNTEFEDGDFRGGFVNFVTPKGIMAYKQQYTKNDDDTYTGTTVPFPLDGKDSYVLNFDGFSLNASWNYTNKPFFCAFTTPNTIYVYYFQDVCVETAKRERPPNSILTYEPYALDHTEYSRGVSVKNYKYLKDNAGHTLPVGIEDNQILIYLYGASGYLFLEPIHDEENDRYYLKRIDCTCHEPMNITKYFMNVYPVTRLKTEGEQAYGYSGITHSSYYVKDLPNSKKYDKIVKITDAAIILNPTNAYSGFILDSTIMDNRFALVQALYEENVRLNHALNAALSRIERLEYNTYAIRRIV